MKNLHNQTIKNLSSSLFFIVLLFITGCNRGNQLGMDEDLIPRNRSKFIKRYNENKIDNATHKLVSREGHQVTLYQTTSGWVAKVEEKLPAGFKHVIDMAVFIEEGFTVEQLLETAPHVKNNQLQVTLPTNNQQGWVYIGNGGLRGGGGGVSRCSPDDILDIPESIALTAENQIGSDKWAYRSSRGYFGPDTHKCNLFVCEVIAAVGAKATTRSTSEQWYKRLFERPLLVREWADPHRNMLDWSIVSEPARGDVVAEDYSTTPECPYTGHVGIVVEGGNFGASVSVDSASGLVVRSSFGFRSTERPLFRRFTGASGVLLDSLI
ncbi:MAG: hypothetical protein K2X94_04800 [Amoebophilaceae bacterium]|nr:hypothetical protein [Amoebophilaceae bacterium]